MTSAESDLVFMFFYCPSVVNALKIKKSYYMIFSHFLSQLNICSICENKGCKPCLCAREDGEPVNKALCAAVVKKLEASGTVSGIDDSDISVAWPNRIVQVIE